MTKPIDVHTVKKIPYKSRVTQRDIDGFFERIGLPPSERVDRAATFSNRVSVEELRSIRDMQIAGWTIMLGMGGGGRESMLADDKKKQNMKKIYCDILLREISAIGSKGPDDPKMISYIADTEKRIEVLHDVGPRGLTGALSGGGLKSVILELEAKVADLSRSSQNSMRDELKALKRDDATYSPKEEDVNEPGQTF